MNRNYDSLSRYPYGTSEERALIKKYLDEREIKYIIDYSIDPYLFMDYIYYPGFIAYHIEDYNLAADSLYYLNNYEIVDVVEKLYEKNYYDLNVFTSRINNILSRMQYNSGVFRI